MMTSLILTGESKPEEALELPQGRLIIGELMVSFSPESVLKAAQEIVAQCEHDLETHIFVSQAGIIAHAANELNWNRERTYKTI